MAVAHFNTMKTNFTPIIKCSVALLALMIGGAGCRFHETKYLAESEPLNMEDFNDFRKNHEITTSQPSMEEIAWSMDFLQRGDPFELMRYWVGEGFVGTWKGEDWIDLFEGEGDCPPMALEKISGSHPLNVKVIVWTRKKELTNGSSYLMPFLRHEYIVELEKHGWRKKQKLIKQGPSPMDRLYIYDSRTQKPGKTVLAHPKFE
jgi:hypothetical protein